MGKRGHSVDGNKRGDTRHRKRCRARRHDEVEEREGVAEGTKLQREQDDRDSFLGVMNKAALSSTTTQTSWVRGQ